MGCPALEIQGLSRAVTFARDRVIQGDWGITYANQQLAQQVKEAEQMLVFFGCSKVSLYATVSPSGRGILKWTYLDKDGERFDGYVHPTGF
jgi:hypothetical protein